MANGTVRVSATELAQFAAYADVHPVAEHLWLLNTESGETRIERRGDYWNIPDGWALIMTGPDPAWVAQWDGNWQRACEEQLNPMIAEALGGAL